MELNILENTKNRLKFELKGEGHTFCNALKKELWSDNNIEISGYHIEHSLVSEPAFTIETSKGDPKTVLLKAVERLRKRNKELREFFKKL
ncbi:MAG: DNA-directed RNA polymerase subunit L [Nanoarchaeota archaeon]